MTAVYLETLGCAKNLVDSEVMLGRLEQAGFLLTGDPRQADIIIVNTCAFIADAVSEAVETILSLARFKQDGSCQRLVVCGCLPQRYKEQLAAELPEVDLFLGTGEFSRIAKHLNRLGTGPGDKKVIAHRKTFLQGAHTPRVLTAPGSAAYVKLAEGCSHRCSFCTIPSIKGPYRERSAESVLTEARHLARSGIAEINLISQDTSRYSRLPELIRRLTRIRNLEWIRLLYCHPLTVSDDLIDLFSGEEKLCSYIDIPLQHIADPILKRMGRNMTGDYIRKKLDRIRSRCPDIAVRTSFIVGFPGETDRDFRTLCGFAAEQEFDRVGVFTYSEEEGSAAASHKDIVTGSVKKQRRRELMRLQAAVSRRKNRRLCGRELRVLVDGISLNTSYLLQARTEYQAPEVDGVVYINENVPIGSFVRVRIAKALTHDLVGTVRNQAGAYKP